MTCHISFRDIQFFPGIGFMKVVVTTDVPSHCWLRVSKNEPQIHKKSGSRRGYPFIEDLRVCFTAFTDYEQEEAGDTLVHTFRVPGWAEGDKWWILVWGTIDGETCVSTSPPMSSLSECSLPLPDPLTFYGSGDDTCGQAPDTYLSWAAAHNAASARWMYIYKHFNWWTTRAWAYRNYTSGFLIYRNWIFFDTRQLISIWDDLFAVVKLRLYIPAGTNFWKGQLPTHPHEDGKHRSRGDIFVTENKALTRPPTKTPGG